MSGTTCLSSDLLSASAIVYTGRGTLNALTVLTDGTNPATVTVYDNTAASGVVLMKGFVQGTDRTNTIALNLAVRCKNGLYVSISGTGAAAIVYYGA